MDAEADLVSAEQASRRVLPDSDWDTMRAAFPATIKARAEAMGPIHLSCCDSWARLIPDRVAIRDLTSGRDWTYAELQDASIRLAGALQAAGVVRGDRVAIFLPQSAQVMVAHFAAHRLGAISVPLFTLFGMDALAFRLRDSAAAAVLTDAENLDRIEGLRGELPALRTVLTLPLATAHPLPADLPDIGADDPAVMIYTSGTTGPPKGALHAHRFLLGHLPSMEISHERFPQPGDCGWTPADWAWIGGLMDMAMPCLYYGVPLIARRLPRFDPAEAAALINGEGVRNAFLPPTALKLMRAAGLPTLHLRSVSSGGEALGAELLGWGQAQLGCAINELYGQTECNLAVTQAAGFMTVRPGAMGKALPGFDVAVIAPDGSAAAPGMIGEIAIRRGAPSMFLGYWNQPEKTAAKFTGDWMRTGDLGTCGADGYLSYVSRDDDLITSAGYRIGPSEIEACLSADPDIVMAAVVGVPDPVRTEVVVAHLVLRDGVVWSDALAMRLAASVRLRVGAHLVPRRFVVQDALPMTATGKILRRVLRDAGIGGA